jgi:hypothetical protein
MPWSIPAALSDRAQFIAGIANRRRNRKVSATEPVYALSAAHGLNIIYELSGEEIEVLDLMGEATCNDSLPSCGKSRKKGKEILNGRTHALAFRSKTLIFREWKVHEPIPQGRRL